MANATPAQKEYYAKNAAKYDKKEKDKDYEIFGSRGDAAKKGMEEGRMDPMGTAYKKGGTASARADGCAMKGKTKGTIIACTGGYMKGKK